MDMTKVVVSDKTVEEFDGELLVGFVTRGADGEMVPDMFLQPILESLELAEFEGKKQQNLLLYPPYSKKKKILNSKRLLIIGLDEIENLNNSQLFELLRESGGLIAREAKKCKCAKIGVYLPQLPPVKEYHTAERLVEGVLLGSYQFLKYKTKDKDQFKGLKKISIITPSESTEIKAGITRAFNSCLSAMVARNMANEPGNGWTPTHFAKYAKRLGKSHDLKCTIFGKSEMKKLGMGGLLAVNQGSKESPKFIILDYNPEQESETILLVGKGLTFDSGGVSLKPGAGMMDMKYDMCGGAAALSAMEAVAREKPDVRVVAIVPSTDNMAGGGAVKPGDVITHYGGITSEIDNTDAEGRLILADALAYGIEKFKPTCVIDLATLTGAVIVALGHHHTGLLSNNENLVDELIKAGKKSGEPAWQLPLGENYAKQIKSQVADIKNTGGKGAGTITAAEYLHKFVGDTPWAHMDIAGTAWDFTEKSYIPKGPSGTGTRTLIEFIRHWTTGRIVADKN